MPNPLGNPVRISLLVIILGSTLGVLGRAIVVPKSEKTDLRATFSFPPTVPLAGWRSLESRPLQPETETELPPGQRYLYRNPATTLDVETRVMAADDDVRRFLLVYTPIRGSNINLVIKHQPNIGFYGVLAHEGRAYLSACINRQGGSTVTEQQFMRNRYVHDLQVNRVLPWLLGRETLIDRRCLWTLMSMPLSMGAESNSIASEKALKALETAWFSWYQWWQPKFLKS